MSLILDPARPAMIFDGLIPVHSTCVSCGLIMTVTDPTMHTHPLCEPEPASELDKLLVGWMSCVMAGDAESEALTAKEIEEIACEPPDLGAAAVEYASWQWPVFPLARHSKMPAIPKSKGGNGFKDAKTDVERIARWWSRNPTDNIGLATGHLFDCIDVDPSKGGVESLISVLRGNTEIDCHGIVATASGGMHLYIKTTGKGCFQNLRPGIDYRGRGGYVVGAPSTLGSPGRAYSWLVAPSPRIKGWF